VGRFGRPDDRWEDHNIMDLKEPGRKGVDWIDLAQEKKKWLCVWGDQASEKSDPMKCE